jgi:IS5 family transposase
VKVDRDSKLIVKHIVTAASVHDSQEFVDLIDSEDKGVWGDSAFVGSELREQVLKKNPNLKLHICERGTRGHPLTGTQKERNHKKSKVRCRVEHVFGYMTNSMGGLFVRGIGIARASCVMALKDLAYNLWRSSYLLGPPKVAAV